jgi:pimeloyl-ACP methyl ester carboxylesterase
MLSSRSMPRRRDSERQEGGRRGLAKLLLLLAAALGVPAAINLLIRRRARAPRPPRWGRAHRYAGRGGELVFQELGQQRAGAPPLLLLHSFGPGYDADQWRAAAEILASEHHVYVPELPGWGRSAAPPGPLSARVYLDAVAGFLDAVVREPAVVVAAGLPAAYAVRVAAEPAARVRALALVAPLGLGAATDGAKAATVRRLLCVPLLRATLLDLLTSHAALEVHLHQTYAAPERVDAALLDHHYRVSHLPPARRTLAAYLRGELALADAEIDAALSTLVAPVWIAWGRAAGAPPVAAADLWLRRLPRAQLEVLEGAGDLPHAETFAAFCRALDRFLAGLA